eukprot:TRINITY_DN15838_c0_g1_i2.p1 TRINITY_DN15838_c0_g1~~TRINITY_DN15838_c0_g1_i2.p1  ORF type:complete len:761 (+),score=102.57 TRINITY_DN15838_c0_g1_i2:38-2320(+)
MPTWAKTSESTKLKLNTETPTITLPTSTTHSEMSPKSVMTLKTPLSKMAKLFRKGNTEALSSFDEARHVERSGTLHSQEKSLLVIVWIMLMMTAVLSSTLSFLIDAFTFYAGLLRSKLVLGGAQTLAAALLLNITMAILARIIVRTTVEAEGGGFPEMKAMLFGKVLFSFLTFRVLVVKAVGLALLVGAGLPLGKEGPNVHMAGCIVYCINPHLFQKRAESDHHAGGGAAGSGVDSAISRLLLAACAVGVGASFSAPIGGVIFALELMMPQTYDAWAYWGCFTAGVIGGVTYAVERTVTTQGSEALLPLISTNVLPGEGANSDYPVLRLLLDVALGAVCGAMGGIWVRMHAYIAGVLKRWRLREPDHFALIPAKPGKQEPLLAEDGGSGVQSTLARCTMKVLGGKWRDLALVIAVVSANTFLAAGLPLLGSKPQPLLISNIFDKNLYDTSETWTVPWAGTGGTLILCFVMKFFMTILSLSCPIPGGMVLPTMIIGGLLARSIVHNFLPLWLIDTLTTTGGQPMTEVEHGAFVARCAIVGACTFCAGVSRAFAMAITVFEVLALPNSVLPLCSSTLVAIFVANRVALPFFDQNLANRNLGGIPTITFTEKAAAPAMSFMTPVNLEHCLPQMTTLREMLSLLTISKDVNYPIIRPLDWKKGNAGLLEGNITRKHLEKLLKRLDPAGDTPDQHVDLLDPQLQAPEDGSEPLVVGKPPCVSPEITIKEVYLLMRHCKNEGVIYVTDRGVLRGSITFVDLIARQI